MKRNDKCIMPGRTIRITIGEAFDKDTYGYMIENSELVVRVDRNDNDRQIHGAAICDSRTCLPEPARPMVAGP